MTRSDWLEVGLKLLGTYFLVAGLIAVWRAALALLVTSGQGVGDGSAAAVALLSPVAGVLAGIVLIRLRWELPDPARRRGEPIPGYLEEQFRRMEGEGESPPR
jgi:hypothetical protein